MAAIITPLCLLYAASLAQPVQGFFVLSVTFDRSTVGTMRALLRTTLKAEHGIIGRRATVRLTDLEDGRWLIRFLAKERPQVVDVKGQRVIVEPPVGSVLRIDADLRPMRSCVGVMPIMRRIIVIDFAQQREH
jgi:hypothetical protein